MPEQATGIVLAYKRLANLPQIVESMLACERIQEVLVWDNGPLNAVVECDIPAIRCMSEHGNIFALGRYECARSMGCRQVVAVQDDDCLVENWDELFARFDKTDRLVCNMPLQHAAFYRNRYRWHVDGRDVQSSLVGFGSVFRREWVSVLDLYRAKYGEDDLLKRKADRAFTCLLPAAEWIIREPQHLPGATDEHALYRQKGFWADNERMHERCLDILRSSTSADAT